MIAFRVEHRIATANDVAARIERIIGSASSPDLGELPPAQTTMMQRVQSTPPVQKTTAAAFKLVTTTGQSIPLTQAETVIGRSHPRDPSIPDVDLWALGLAVSGIGTTTAGINFIASILGMGRRAVEKHLERVYPKLLAGYVYDALESAGETVAAEQVLATLSRCVAKRGPSVALGEDVRIEGKGAIASGLAVGGELVQISAYG